MQSKEFRLQQDTYKKVRKKLLLIFIPLMVIAVGVGFSIAHFNVEKTGTDMISLLLPIPIAFFIIVPSVMKTMKRQKEQFQSYRLTFDGTLLTREQKDTPTVQLSFLEIKEIVKVSNGSFVIQGFEKGDCIHVPTQIESYQEVETVLNNIMPVTTKLSKSLLHKYGWLLALVMLGLMMVVFVARHAIVVTGCGILLLAFLSWAWFEARSNKSIDEKTRKGSWWLLIIMLAAMARIVSVWLERP